jgi:hypothetical protein
MSISPCRPLLRPQFIDMALAPSVEAATAVPREDEELSDEQIQQLLREAEERLSNAQSLQRSENASLPRYD